MILSYDGEKIHTLGLFLAEIDLYRGICLPFLGAIAGDEQIRITPSLKDQKGMSEVLLQNIEYVWSKTQA